MSVAKVTLHLMPLSERDRSTFADLATSIGVPEGERLAVAEMLLQIIDGVRRDTAVEFVAQLIELGFDAHVELEP